MSLACVTEPTYGKLIDLFIELEGKANLQESLHSEISVRYPKLLLGRPARVLDTIKRSNKTISSRASQSYWLRAGSLQKKSVET